MADALAKVKKDLGKDAVILHTRTLTRGGVLGIGARSIVEITATNDAKVTAFRRSAAAGGAGEELPSPKPSPRMHPAVQTLPGGTYAPTSATARPEPTSGARTELRGLGRAVVQSPQSAPAVALDRDPKANSQPPANEAALRRELTEIRAMVRDLVVHARNGEGPELPESFADCYSRLVEQEVREDLALQIVQKTAERLRVQSAFRVVNGGDEGSESSYPAQTVEMELRKVVTESLPPASPLKLREDGKATVVALVGPTGVGKTTTVAKLAANMKLRENKRVGLITIDSYRIAAVEQLKTYAQILRVPIISVLKPDEIQAAVEQLADQDLILIDTAGRSQKDDLRIAELREFIEAANPDQIHLVLSMTSKEKTIREAIDRFSRLGAEQLLFTKLDEATGLGVILNVLQDVNMRLSYLTNGQAVPDDIEIGSAGRVARLVVGESGGTRNSCESEQAPAPSLERARA